MALNTSRSGRSRSAASYASPDSRVGPRAPDRERPNRRDERRGDDTPASDGVQPEQGARGRLRSATPPAREPRSPAAAASLPALSQAVDQGLERVGRGVTVEPLAVHVERRRAADAERFALLQARLDAAGIALAVHAGV